MSKRTTHIALVSAGAILAVGIILLLLMIFKSPLSGEKSFDFGVVPIERPSRVLEHTFHLINTTDHTLKLADAIPTCGCTTTNWPDTPVLSGEELLVPVHLKLQQSRYRSSKVRLEFESGEIAVLTIEGTGRFIQPLQCLPPSISLADGNNEGTRCVLSLEWFEEHAPTQPTFVLPTNVRVESDAWTLSKKGDKHRGTPDKWTIRLHVMLEGALETGSVMKIEVVKSPELIVPLEQVDSIERPPFFPGTTQ